MSEANSRMTCRRIIRNMFAALVAAAFLGNPAFAQQSKKADPKSSTDKKAAGPKEGKGPNPKDAKK